MCSPESTSNVLLLQMSGKNWKGNSGSGGMFHMPWEPLMANMCYVWYHGLFVSCLGGVGVGLELFFLVISICTVLFCFGRGIGITCS